MPWLKATIDIVWISDCFFFFTLSEPFTCYLRFYEFSKFWFQSIRMSWKWEKRNQNKTKFLKVFYWKISNSLLEHQAYPHYFNILLQTSCFVTSHAFPTCVCMKQNGKSVIMNLMMAAWLSGQSWAFECRRPGFKTLTRTTEWICLRWYLGQIH